jgi:predicted HD phosphohydrolase
MNSRDKDLEDLTQQRAQFTRIEDATRRDLKIMGAHRAREADLVVDRVLLRLRELAELPCGLAVDLLTHNLQTATRAQQGGEDEEYVVCALLHDLGDTFGYWNHAQIAAAVLQPFVSEENRWMVEKHGLFQGYYYLDKLGVDREVREQHRGHPYFERTERFCELYDNSAFDPHFATLPLDAFEPLLRRVFSRVPRSLYRRTE